MNAPHALREAFTRDINAAIGNRIFDAVGLKNGEGLLGSGGREGRVNPSRQENLPDLRDPGVEPKVKLAAALYGKLMHQDGVAYHQPVWTGDLKDDNGMDLVAGRPLDPTETATLYHALTKELQKEGLSEKDAQSIAPIPTRLGIRFLNFTDIDNTKFQEAVNRAIETFPFDTIRSTPFQSMGDMVSNDWETQPHGEGYTNAIREAGRSNLSRRLEADLGPKIHAIEERYIQKARDAAQTPRFALRRENTSTPLRRG